MVQTRTLCKGKVKHLFVREHEREQVSSSRWDRIDVMSSGARFTTGKLKEGLIPLFKWLIDGMRQRWA